MHTPPRPRTVTPHRKRATTARNHPSTDSGLETRFLFAGSTHRTRARYASLERSLMSPDSEIPSGRATLPAIRPPRLDLCADWQATPRRHPSCTCTPDQILEQKPAPAAAARFANAGWLRRPRAAVRQARWKNTNVRLPTSPVHAPSLNAYAPSGAARERGRKLKRPIHGPRGCRIRSVRTPKAARGI
jgi:hypothetical protein